MKEIKIKITEEECLELERLTYEATMLKDNICFLLESNRHDINFLDTPVFQEYQKRQIETNSQLSQAKNRLEKNYLKDINYLRWELDFITEELKVTCNE